MLEANAFARGGGGEVIPCWMFQDVLTRKPIAKVNEGVFAEIFDKYCVMDGHLALSGEPRYTTRLRVYNAYSLAAIVSHNKVPGVFLHVGISYGTNALVISEMLASCSVRKYYFVDPMENNESPLGYCNNPSIVYERWAERAPLTWIKEFCSSSVIQKIGEKLAFAHLNSGDDVSELEALPVIWDKLSQGGIILYDCYGFRPDSQMGCDALLDEIGAHTWQLATGQLAIFKGAIQY